MLPDYLSASLPLEGLAARHRLTLDQLLDILDSPEFEHLLARVERTAARRATAIARAAAPEATLALADIAYRAADRNPDPARKAANAILKLASPSGSSFILPPSSFPTPAPSEPARTEPNSPHPNPPGGRPGGRAQSEKPKAQIKTRRARAPRPASAELCALSGETAFPAPLRDLRVLRGERQARDPPPPGSRCA